MRIVVNTRLLLKNRLDGIGWFTYETLQRICLQHPEDEFFFLFDRPYDREFIFADNITPIIIGPQARHPFLFWIWFNISLPPILKKINPDIYLSPDGYNCLPYKGKNLMVIHDLNFEHYPKDVTWLVRKFYQRYFPLFTRHATRIATVSKYSKTDIVKQYGVDESLIDIVYDGVNEAFRPISINEQHEIRNRYTAGKPFFLFVGSLHPRKNLANLFRAFDQFRENDHQSTKLLVVGAKYYWSKEIRQVYQSMKYKEDVILPGRLDIEELVGVTGSALALTYVSYFEGFGIPILEAFACKTPVITSNTTSMPEVAGDAALLVDPFNPESISDAMTRIATTPDLRNTLIQKGLERIKQFSWQNTSELLYYSIQKTANQ